MSMEKKNLNEQENLSPFDIEKIEEIKIPKVEVHDGVQLSVGGEVQNQYNRINPHNKFSFQKNNENLVHFSGTAVIDDEKESEWAERVIDVNEPKKELLNIIKDEEKNILVNGKKWDSLRGKDVYFGGYRVEIDPEGKKIVFAETGHKNQSVIVNNSEWKTKFNGIQFATSRFGNVYAIGDTDFYQNSRLVVDDKEWVYQKFTAESNQEKDHVVNATIGKNDQVVAVVDSIRTKDRRSHILIGDKIGAKNEWKNTLNKVERIVTDDETGSVAVFGETEYNSKKMGLIINDTPYQIEGNPENLEVFKFEKGAVVIQYRDALGEKTTEKIMFRENAKEVQEMKEKKEAQEKAFEDLRHMLVKENIPANEIVNRLKKVDDLGKETEKVKNLSETVNKLIEEKTKMQLQIEASEKTHKEEVRTLEVKLTEAEMVVIKLENILKGAGKTTFGSDSKLSADSMRLALESIQDLREKHNWIKGK